MNFALPLVASVAVIGLLVWMYRAMLGRRFLALAWPHGMGFHAFRNRVARYLRHKGWVITDLPFSPWPFKAEKAGSHVVLQCYPAGTTFSSNFIQGLEALAHQLLKTRYMGTAMVAVLAEKLPAELREEAAARNLNIVFYKDLEKFAEIPKPTHEAMESHFDTIALDNWALVRLSQRLMAKEDFAGAETAARLAAMRNTDNAAALAHLSDVLKRRGDNQGAFDILFEATEKYPDDPWCHFRLSRLYLETGDFPAAMEEAQSALKFNPTDEFLAQHLNQLRIEVDERGARR